MGGAGCYVSGLLANAAFHTDGFGGKCNNYSIESQSCSVRSPFCLSSTGSWRNEMIGDQEKLFQRELRRRRQKKYIQHIYIYFFMNKSLLLGRILICCSFISGSLLCAGCEDQQLNIVFWARVRRSFDYLVLYSDFTFRFHTDLYLDVNFCYTHKYVGGYHSGHCHLPNRGFRY